MFWIVAICLVMLVMLAIYVPLGRVTKTDTTKPALMRALAAELSEVNADKGERFATPAEAGAARAEIGRRLLALESAPEKPQLERRSSQLFAVFALMPILAVPLYLQLGQPEYADQNFATRLDGDVAEGQQEVAKLIDRVEKRLVAQPEDSEGWAVIAPVYFRLGRIDDSLNAYTQALAFFKGEPAQKLRLMADRAEIMVAKADGQVSVVAANAFREVLVLDQNYQKALFYSAIYLEQTGAPEKAIANWEALVARFKGDNPPWMEVAERRLATLKNPPVVEPGPTADQVEAAKEMTAEQRNDMIRGMVDGLAAKLAENPTDQFGWIKLIRARMVMNDRAQALLDLEKARSLFAPGTQGRSEIDFVAQSMGLAEYSRE